MEGDAGAGQLTQPTTDPAGPVDDEAERSEVEESAKTAPVDDEAERSGAEESAEAEPAETAQRRPSRLNSRGWLVGVSAGLLVLAAALGGAGYLLMRSDAQSAALARSEAAAIDAAKTCVTATQAPDLAAMAASQQKIIECATGDFGAQATLYSGVLVDAYQAAQAQVQVADIRAAVEKHNADGSINVLVALRAKVSNSAAQDQETGYRLRVQMALDNGTYKIARLDQVTK